MATDVIMPALGMDQDQGTLIRWFKLPGEAVTKGEPIMEVETDKVVVEIDAIATGILVDVTANEGDIIPVGQTIAHILAPDDLIARQAPRTPAFDHDELAEMDTNLPPLPSSYAARPPAPTADRVLSSPLARQIAATEHIDLREIAGTGPEGAVLAADVWTATSQTAGLVAESNAAASSSTAKTPASAGPGLQAAGGLTPASPMAEGPPQSATPPAADQGNKTRAAAHLIPPPTAVSAPWRVMADRMTASWTTAPHFFLMREVVVTELIELRRRLLPVVGQRNGVRLTYTDLLVKVLATALRNHPRLNASWVGGSMQLHPDVNVGVAVATADALLVPVMAAADTLSLGTIAQQRGDLVDRATHGRLTPDDVSGGTFTLTNLGMYGVDAFNAIINPPQAAILAVGRIADRVVAVDSQPAVRPTMVLSLSCDHRVVDGATGARFLDELAQLIEEPWRLLV